jgi:glycosyltransferase involved in cell wall biosynthesis
MGNTQNKILLLFTSSYPYGVGEQFIETEIDFLSKAFKEVHIYPISTEGTKRKLPHNVIVKGVQLYGSYSRINLWLRRGFRILSLYKRQLHLTRHRDKYSGRHWNQFNFLSHRVADAEKVAEVLNTYSAASVVVYSYWFNVWAMALLLAKEFGMIKNPILTRAHGGDLDENQKKQKYFPFRSLEIELIDKVVSVSEFGRTLLKDAYPNKAEKFFVSRLGVNDNGLNPEGSGKRFRVVTCSFVYGLKRLHLVADILEQTGLEIEWIHFGDGELMEELRQRCTLLPPRISTVFRGLVPNHVVLSFYSSEHVDLFMNVSELEGIPVSIMEAISFGIPVTGCRVCGVPEIVTERTGFLFEKDIDIARAASDIREYLTQSEAYRLKFRNQVRSFWNEEFNASVNYNRFIDTHLNVSSVI